MVTFSDRTQPRPDHGCHCGHLQSPTKPTAGPSQGDRSVIWYPLKAGAVKDMHDVLPAVRVFRRHIHSAEQQRVFSNAAMMPYTEAGTLPFSAIKCRELLEEHWNTSSKYDIQLVVDGVDDLAVFENSIEHQAEKDSEKMFR